MTCGDWEPSSSYESILAAEARTDGLRIPKRSSRAAPWQRPCPEQVEQVELMAIGSKKAITVAQGNFERLKVSKFDAKWLGRYMYTECLLASKPLTLSSRITKPKLALLPPLPY